MNLYRIRAQLNKAYWNNKSMDFNFKWVYKLPMTEIKFVAGSIYIVRPTGEHVRAK